VNAVQISQKSGMNQINANARGGIFPRRFSSALVPLFIPLLLIIMDFFIGF
jgi:hypothetical protein